MTKKAKKHIRDPYNFTVSLSIMKNSSTYIVATILRLCLLNNTIKYYYVLYSLRPSAVVVSLSPASQLRGPEYVLKWCSTSYRTKQYIKPCDDADVDSFVQGIRFKTQLRK